MNPLLKNSRVRGTPEDPFLQDIKRRREYALEPIHAKILWHCDGSHSIEKLSEISQQPVEDVLEFLKVIVKAGLLELDSIATARFAPLAKSPYLREIQIDATGRCNLFGICKHCYGRPMLEQAAKTELSTAEMFQLFDQMSDLNVGNCFLSGGEIFIRKDLPDLIGYLAEKNICLDGIFTNGTFSRPEVLDAILNTGVKTALLVSLDGHTSEINSYMRGVGNFERTTRFIAEVKNSGLPLTVNTMVTKQTVHVLDEMYVFMKKLGVNRWRLSVPREQGEMIANKDLIMPEWGEIFDAYERLLRTALEDGDSSMRIQLSSIFKTEFQKDKVVFLFHPGSSCCVYKRWALVVKPSGDIVPCTAFDNLKFGNVRTDQLRDIWYADKTQAFKALPLEATECKDCDLKELCGGGCRKIAHYLHGSALAKDDHACPMYRFFAERVMPILSRYGVKQKYLPKPDPYLYNTSIVDQLLIDETS